MPRCVLQRCVCMVVTNLSVLLLSLMRASRVTKWSPWLMNLVSVILFVCSARHEVVFDSLGVVLLRGVVRPGRSDSVIIVLVVGVL